jgi:hypothetical protein
MPAREFARDWLISTYTHIVAGLLMLHDFPKKSGGESISRRSLQRLQAGLSGSYRCTNLLLSFHNPAEPD